LDSYSFENLEKLNQSDEKFYQRIRKILPKEYLDETRKIKSEQDLRDFVNKAIAEAEHGKGELGIRRLHGINKAGKVLTDFQDRLSKFLAGYSGIVALVQTAGGRYGNLAYGSLSLILAVSLQLNWNTQDALLSGLPRSPSTKLSSRTSSKPHLVALERGSIG